MFSRYLPSLQLPVLFLAHNSQYPLSSLFRRINALFHLAPCLRPLCRAFCQGLPLVRPRLSQMRAEVLWCQLKNARNLFYQSIINY